ncbi:hypothetical protein CN326_04470 [Bacillus sp. AFS018417]|nr:hypothetical protein CN326_04470 [Bacillus sp. AFS018417]
MSPLLSTAAPKTSSFYPALTGSKTPTSRLRESEEDRRGVTTRKSPIGSTNHQWRIKPPTDGSFTLFLRL